jgi:putative addiction module component (TIGR02574 family)
MTDMLRELERKAAMLSPEERELLAERLLDSVQDAPLSDEEEEWAAEVELRYSEWKAGKTAAVPCNEVFADIRKELRESVAE